MPRPSHSASFYHPNNICWAVQIIKLLIMQFSPLPRHLIPLRPKHLPQHPILKHPVPMFLPRCERPSSAPIQNNRQSYSSLYLNLHVMDTTSKQHLIQQGRWSRPTKIRGLQNVSQNFISAIFKLPSSDPTDVAGEDPKKCSCSWHNYRGKNDFSLKQQECGWRIPWHSSNALQRQYLLSKYH